MSNDSNDTISSIIIIIYYLIRTTISLCAEKASFNGPCYPHSVWYEPTPARSRGGMSKTLLQEEI